MKKAMFAMGAALMFLCGCQMFNRMEEPVVEPGTVEAEIKIGETMLNAYVKNDAGAFLAVLAPEVKERFGEKEFKTTRDQITEAMGKIEKIEYLTVLTAPGFRSHLWKVTFKRTKVMDKDVELTQETLFRVVMTTPKDGKKPFTLTFGFL